MPCVGDLGVPEPADNVGKVVSALVLFGEAEAAAHENPVDVPLVAVYRTAGWGREPHVGD
jgi:hypothetical protein